MDEKFQEEYGQGGYAVCCWGLTFRVFTLNLILVKLKNDAREMTSSKLKNYDISRSAESCLIDWLSVR